MNAQFSLNKLPFHVEIYYYMPLYVIFKLNLLNFSSPPISILVISFESLWIKTPEKAYLNFLSYPLVEI